MQAVILAGGFATRLRPLSCTRPKILFPIVNKPLLEWTFEGLARNGIKEVIMAVSYQTELGIKQQQIAHHGLHVAFSRDPLKKPLGSGGPIKKAEERIGNNESFLVLNGDIFADINYSELMKLHESRKATATIALHEVKDPSRYGVARLAKNNRITEFIEKPPAGTAPSNLINAGIYVLSPEIFTHMPKDRAFSIEREIFTKLAREGTLCGYVHKGLWMDIGKPEDYLEVNMALLNSVSGQTKTHFGKDVKIRSPVAFDKGVTLEEKSVVGPHVILGHDVFIGKGARIENSIVFPGTEISDFAQVNGSIIGENVFVGKNAKISDGCILGDFVKIRENTTLSKRVWVCPSKEISGNVPTSRNII